MADNIGKLIITDAAESLITRLVAGSTTVQFTKIASSDEDYSQSNLKELQEIKIKQETQISHVDRKDDKTVVVYGAIDAAELTEGYYIRTIGLYAKDADGEEILYGIVADDHPRYLEPCQSESATVSSATFKFYVKVTNASKVSIEVDPGAVPTLIQVQEIEKAVEELERNLREDVPNYVKDVSFDKDVGAILVTKGDGRMEDIPVSSEAYVVADTAPQNTKQIWIDTSSGGVMKYFDGTNWVPTPTVLTSTPSDVVGAIWYE